uniref:Uncharacterized protein n=1 Tax=Salix viminalis TaxID=40686 RepID=A0A6N2LJ50_SALVM
MNYPLLLLCLLLAFACTKQSVAAAEPVVDIDGEKLVAGTKYYILPVFRGRGGGITMARNKTSCPLAVVQDRLELSKGLPLTFTPAVDNKKGILGFILRMTGLEHCLLVMHCSLLKSSSRKL